MNKQHHIPRIEMVDFARGIALLAMTLFHFGWDMELLGIAEPGFAGQPAMVWFARCIANSFIFLTGVGLVLAHQNGFNKKAYMIRLAKVSAAAALISIATYYATPAAYIFFGILHHIALASVIGLLFIRLPYWANIAFGILTLTMGLWLTFDVFNNPIWSWTGLSTHEPKSSDFVPIFPYFASVLFGIAITQIAVSKTWIAVISKFKFGNKVGGAIKYIGRHSLLYYLLHQPIMIGIITLIIYIA